jgi:hypothetical protein
MKPINARQHALIDYILAGSLLILSPLLGLNKKAKRIYTVEALLSSSITVSEPPPVAKSFWIFIFTASVFSSASDDKLIPVKLIL